MSPPEKRSLHGWLVHVDPASGRVELELGPGASRIEVDGRLVVTTRGAAAPALPAALPGVDPAAPVSPAAPEAIAVWSPATSTLSLVRDRTGAHPLFLARVGSATVASTDLRALLGRPGVSREPSAVAVAEWLLERPGPPEETLIASVSRVPAGHVTTISPAGAETRRTWEPPAAGAHDADAADGFGAALEEAVARVLEGPAAVLLSGGIDSSAVAAAAAAASRRAGLPAPVALCADIEGSSEAALQRRVADALGLERVERRYAPSPEGLDRAVDLAGAAPWPVASAWSPVFDDLLAAAGERGVAVVLDGIGGDELLDAGLGPARSFLRAGRLGALRDLIRAERAYGGAGATSVLRSALRRGRPPRPAPLPAWVVDPALRRALEERAAAPPPDDDLLDTFVAAGREASFAAGAAGGYLHAQPLLDAEVVGLVRGLPREALVRGGDAKSPARAYLRARVSGIAGPWPRPAVVGEMLDRLLRDAAPASGGALGELGIDPGAAATDLDSGLVWSMLSVLRWLENTRG